VLEGSLQAWWTGPVDWGSCLGCLPGYQEPASASTYIEQRYPGSSAICVCFPVLDTPLLLPGWLLRLPRLPALQGQAEHYLEKLHHKVEKDLQRFLRGNGASGGGGGKQASPGAESEAVGASGSGEGDAGAGSSRDQQAWNLFRCACCTALRRGHRGHVLRLPCCHRYLSPRPPISTDFSFSHSPFWF
jgi:hypothetical protein